MRGLLLKEWYMILRYAKGYAFVSLVFFAVSVFADDNLFFSVYPLLLSGIIPVSMIAYDEKSGWFEYSAALPYTRKMIVSAKYISALCIVVVMVIFTCIVQAVSTAAGKEVSDMTLFVAAGVGLLPPSLMLPFVFKYGSEKGRMMYIGVVILICAFIPLMAAADDAGMVSMPWIVTVFPLICAGAFAVSWISAVKAFRARELD